MSILSKPRELTLGRNSFIHSFRARYSPHGRLQNAWAMMMLASALLTGCDADPLAWEQATSSNTVEAYQSYLSDFPDGDFAGEAINRFFHLQPISADVQHAFDEAAKRDMHCSYKLFAANHRGSLLALRTLRRLAHFGVFEATTEVSIPIQELKQEYQWDGTRRLWRCGTAGSASSFPNGSVLFLSKNATTPGRGVPFEFGSPAVISGQTAVGNLEIMGEFRLDASGLVLMDGSRMIYPVPEAEWDDATDERVDVDLQDALYLASLNGHETIVRALLANRVDIDLQNNDGLTALYMASVRGHEAIVQALLAEDATFIPSNNGFSPLMVASQEGHDVIVRALLAKGAAINHQNKVGATSLYMASQQGHETVVRTLLDEGADANLPEEDRITALTIASSKAGNEGIVRALLAAGAEIDHQANNGITALFIASRRGHEAIVQTLLAHGANVDLRTTTGKTALDVAKTDQIKRLLKTQVQRNNGEA